MGCDDAVGGGVQGIGLQNRFLADYIHRSAMELAAAECYGNSLLVNYTADPAVSGEHLSTEIGGRPAVFSRIVPSRILDRVSLLMIFSVSAVMGQCREITSDRASKVSRSTYCAMVSPSGHRLRL